MSASLLASSALRAAAATAPAELRVKQLEEELRLLQEAMLGSWRWWDAFDAMVSDRCYRRAMPVEEAIRRLDEGRGSQLDPAIVDRFIAIARRHIGEVAPFEGAGTGAGAGRLIPATGLRRCKHFDRRL